MSDEVKDAILERAARAYAERHDGASADAARTRARILASHERGRQRTVFAMAAAAVLALGLGLPTAWAWSTGALDAWLGEVRTPESSEESETAASDPTQAEAAIPEEAAMPEEAAVTPEEAAVTPELAARPVIGPEPEITAPSEDDEGAADEAPVDPAERRAYRAAHALHFEAQDAAGALDAWDRYLGEYPSGRFAIEARYNRALCLVRLDRGEEAREALVPFAEGRHGAYRRREASALIEALSE
jgi:TolA-binding protein